ncbi:MAG TPA: hypothetical protein VMS98_12045 [Thermoanaerobaculia bacterium]|nr:hypothetical protein [Thermoanaerobaculia bacterium]
MRPEISIFLILLHCAAGSGHATETARQTVVVEAAVVRLAPTIDHLKQTCLVDGDYDACTNFIGFRLQASCAAADRGWRLRASATFRPWIVLHNLRQLPHEQEHINDVRGSVERLITAIETAEFATEDACRQRALEERNAFGSRMRSFAAASNARMHPGESRRRGGSGNRAMR